MGKVWDWYLGRARSRSEPGGLEIVLATRWSAIEQIGRVDKLAEEGIEEWRYLRIPMEADSPLDPLGRELGDRLWKDWYTPEMVAAAKRDSMAFLTHSQHSPLASVGH